MKDLEINDIYYLFILFIKKKLITFNLLNFLGRNYLLQKIENKNNIYIYLF